MPLEERIYMKLMRSFIPNLLLCCLWFGLFSDILGQSVERNDEYANQDIALTEISLDKFSDLTEELLIPVGYMPELWVHLNMYEAFYYSRCWVSACGRTKVYYYIDGVRIKGIPNLPVNSISWLDTIKGGHPAEFGNDDQLGKSVNRIPTWRYVGVLTDTQLMTLHRTRSYRYRNSIL